MPWRFLIYGLVLLYLLGDLYIFRGPLHHKMTAPPSAPEGTVVTVNGWPVLEDEVERDIRIYCLARGLDPESLTEERRKAIHAVALNRRIDELVLYQYARLEPPEVTKEELDAAVDRFRKQFVSDDSFAERLEAQELDEIGLRTWLESRLMQQKWIEDTIAEAVAVTGEEVETWYRENLDSGFVPELLRVRHLFLTLDDKDAAEVEKEIREHHAAIKVGGESLADRATEFSDDLRSKKRGGDLGYFTKSRMPADFYKTVADLEVGEISQPFKTELGWHIAELLERKPSRRASFEEMKDEIAALLENDRREDAVDRLTLQLRAQANVQVFSP